MISLHISKITRILENILLHNSRLCIPFLPWPFGLPSARTDGDWERASGGGHGECCSGEPAAYERWSLGGHAAQHGLSHHRAARRWLRWLRWRRQLRGTSAVSAELSKWAAVLENGRRKRRTPPAPVWTFIYPLPRPTIWQNIDIAALCITLPCLWRGPVETTLGRGINGVETPISPPRSSTSLSLPLHRGGAGGTPFEECTFHVTTQFFKK